MSRKIKNALMLVVIIAVCIISYFTMMATTKSIKSKNTLQREMGETPPIFNNQEFSNENMPANQMDEVQNLEMPDNGEFPEDFENIQIPNREEFEKNERPNMEGVPENFPESFMNGEFSKQKFNPTINTIYYILFFVEGLSVGLVVIYLIMSKFNAKTLKETFNSVKKIILFICLIIIVSVGLTVIQTVLVKNMITNNVKQFDTIQGPRGNINDFSKENVDEVE